MHKRAYSLLKKEHAAKELKARKKLIANLERRMIGEIGTRTDYQSNDPEMQFSLDQRGNQTPDVLFS